MVQFVFDFFRITVLRVTFFYIILIFYNVLPTSPAPNHIQISALVELNAGPFFAFLFPRQPQSGIGLLFVS
jgi:hypothetical protein